MLAEDLSLAIRRELAEISYLGPLRKKPERDYVWNKTSPGELALDGGNVIQILLASALSGPRNARMEMLNQVSKWLRRMGVAKQVEVRQLGRSSRYEVVVHKDGVAANLHDVGTGISQVLPVITLAYFAPAGSTIILEEPEIHLHPLAQSVLAELFVEVSRERRVQFIVETHSEHVFRRLQTVIARGDADAELCRLYFVEREGPDAKLRTLELDSFGRVQDWPDYFFGDAIGETREQARLMFARQKERRESLQS
ncbi:MAG: AAA family ATPase [Chloroflexota bacterium]